MKQFWVYLMSNKSRRLYAGMTSDIGCRVIEHKQKLYPNSFTARYCYDTLAWFEEHPTFWSARRKDSRSRGGGRKRRFR